MRIAAPGLLAIMLVFGGVANGAESNELDEYAASIGAALLEQFVSGEPDQETAGYLERGIAAAGRKDWDLAIEQFAKAQARSPRGPQILFNLGVAHAGAGHELIGAAWFMSYLSEKPQARNAAKVMWEVDRLKTAHHNKIDKLFRLAHELADDIRDENERNRARYKIAKQQAGTTDFESLSRVISRIKNINAKGRSRIWMLHAKEAAGSGGPLVAESMIDQVTVPEDRDGVWKEIILVYMWRDDLPGARRAYNKAAFKSTALRKALYDYINQFGDVNEMPELPPQSVFKENLDWGPFWRSLIKSQLEKVKPLDIEDALRKASRQDLETGKELNYKEIPVSVAILAANLATMSKHFRRWENQQAWKLARSQRAEFLDAHSKRGYELASRGDYSGAAASYRRAVALSPDDVLLRKNFAFAVFDSGHADKAIAEFQKLIAQGLRSAGVHYRLGRAFSDKGRSNEAIKQYRKAIVLDPKDPFLRIMLGIEFQYSNRAGEAIEQYGKALHLRPADEDVHGYLGELLADTGRLDEAIAHYRKAVSLDPKNNELREKLKRVLTLARLIREVGPGKKIPLAEVEGLAFWTEQRALLLSRAKLAKVKVVEHRELGGHYEILVKFTPDSAPRVKSFLRILRLSKESYNIVLDGERLTTQYPWLQEMSSGGELRLGGGPEFNSDKVWRLADTIRGRRRWQDSLPQSPVLEIAASLLVGCLVIGYVIFRMRKKTISRA